MHPLLCKCQECQAQLPTKPAPIPSGFAPASLANLKPVGGIMKPGRRVRSLAAYIRGKTRNNKEIVRFYVDVMRDPDCQMNHRMQAAEALLNRSEGKPVERSVMLKIEQESATVSVTGGIGDVELAELIRALGSGNLAQSGNGPTHSSATVEGSITPENTSPGDAPSGGDRASDPSDEDPSDED